FFHNRHGRARRSPQKKDESNDNRAKQEQRDGHFRPAHVCTMSLYRLKLLGKLRITDFIVVKGCNADAHTVFHFAGTEVVQEGSPPLVFFEVLSDVFGEENVAGVAAIHHSLRHVDPIARDVGPLIHINHAANGPAVNSHPKLLAGMFLERTTNLHRALRWRFWTG